MPLNEEYQEDQEPIDEADSDNNSHPLQFGISTLLWLTVAVALVFGTLRWLQVSTTASLIVMAVLAISTILVVILVAAISRFDEDE